MFNISKDITFFFFLYKFEMIIQIINPKTLFGKSLKNGLNLYSCFLDSFCSCGNLGNNSNLQPLKGYSNHQIFFTLMMIMIAEWAIMSTLESAALEIPSKIFWSKLEYIGALTSSVFFLRYAIGVAKIRNKWCTKNFFIFWIIPVAIILLASTNELHNFISCSFSWSPAGNNILTYHHGPGFMVAMGYSLSMVGIALFNIIKALPEMPFYLQTSGMVCYYCQYFPGYFSYYLCHKKFSR